MAFNTIVTVTEALQSNVESESILPTFSCQINNSKVRALKDGGCQSNFIQTNLANTLHLRVINRNVKLTINGINSAKDYNTKLVEVPLKFGNKINKINALCIPAISIVLKIPGLNKVAKKFEERGYILADKDLSSSDTIDKIEFILGTSAGYCVLENEVGLGSRNSCYSDTVGGVIIKGRIDNLLSDVNYLPPYDANVRTMFADIPRSQKQVTKVTCPGLESVNETCLSASIEGTSPPVGLSSNHFRILNQQGNLNETELDRATNEILNQKCEFYTNLDNNQYNDVSVELNEKLIKHVFKHTYQKEDGRLVMPLLWDAKVSHLLGKNRQLAEIILKSNCKKLMKSKTNLKLVNDVFKEQEQLGIIERIDNINSFLEDHPEYSFLPHMGVFRLDKATTKCRVVFLSNLTQMDSSQPLTLSHNQCILSGPCLNQKISSALLNLRFGSKLLCFDLVKAFNQIELAEMDQVKLLFLWYKNVLEEDFTLIGYRNIRLSFGLRCSPTLLMLALYKILILDSSNDILSLKKLKELVYALSYMDNCAITANNTQEIEAGYKQLGSIFSPYKFELQQFLTNDLKLQNLIDVNVTEATPIEAKLLGMHWDRAKDLLYTRPIVLNQHANTKRTILSTIASQFDIYNFNGPLLNRSRLFMHKLQCSKELGWDTVLSRPIRNEWRNIAKQANAAEVMKVKRFVGAREDPYRLIGFSDSSAEIYGAAVYIQNLRTNEINFVLAKNRIVNRQLESKTIPSLEMQGLNLVTECLIDLQRELAGTDCVVPINIVDIHAYSDSLISLSWLHSYCASYDKMQKKAVFVQNRLLSISKLCEQFPITYSFVSGVENPADFITRSISYKKLIKTNYLTGPSFLINGNTPQHSRADVLTVRVPHPAARCDQNVFANLASTATLGDLDHVIPLNSYSSIYKHAWILRRILIFIDKVKQGMKKRDSSRFEHLVTQDANHNYFEQAIKQIIRTEQQIKFGEVFTFFNSNKRKVKDVPNLVNQLNVYIDQEGLLRVKSKIRRWANRESLFPLLLPKSSVLTKIIIRSIHERWGHLGCYSLLAELRKEFWIPHYFSTVKRTLKECITCKRFNERAVKLNQNSYRDFRFEPTVRPYSKVSIDYMGPFLVKSSGDKVKVWLLCISCMYTRAINLKICADLTVKEFLRSFQLHAFEHGLPEYCLTDLGSQLVCGANIITDFLKDFETQGYFEENGIKPLKFDQFVKGHSQLGSLVEVCVKATKKLIYSSIKTNVLTLRDFEFLTCQTVHLVNRRPIAFQEALRDTLSNEIPACITPENLIRGVDLTSINIIPGLQRDPEIDPEWNLNVPRAIQNAYTQLNKVRNAQLSLYHSEFIKTLISQAVDIKDRYKPFLHHKLTKGDIVLVKDPYTKSLHYPMAIVKETMVNDLGEVTGATLIKGLTKEVIKRHSTALIPLLSASESSICINDFKTIADEQSHSSLPIRKKRRAAIVAENRNKQLFHNERID